MDFKNYINEVANIQLGSIVLSPNDKSAIVDIWFNDIHYKYLIPNDYYLIITDKLMNAKGPNRKHIVSKIASKISNLSKSGKIKYKKID